MATPSVLGVCFELVIVRDWKVCLFATREELWMMAITYFVVNHSVNVRRILGKGAKRLPLLLVTLSPCVFWLWRQTLS